MDETTITPKGFLCLVLHAHLPFVRHPECSYTMEENWLFEAITETYLPLLNTFSNLLDDGVPFRITLTMTPPLCSMLADPYLQERYVRHIDKLIELAAKECDRTIDDPEINKSARMYQDHFSFCRAIFVDQYKGNLLPAFKNLQDRGGLEIVASAATHAFLPIMQDNKNAVRAQIQTGIDSHIRFFGRAPTGFWLPECGYYPGVEKILEESGIRYCFVDTHGILYGNPRPRYGAFAPVFCNGTSVAAFARDIESSKQVWSSIEGYPGDFAYRDFYRDIGFDLDEQYIKPYIDPIGIRIHTGLKYYRVTGETNNKEPYDADAAMRRAMEHADDFVANRQQQIDYLASIMDRQPIIVAPYDAELFGHWWFEGPNWLNFLIRKIAFEQSDFALCTPSDYLQIYSRNQICEPSFSSWGYRGYAEVWCDTANDWIYRHLHTMEARMAILARENPDASGTPRRALNQMARELMLAESSDWAFIMKNGTMVQYAVRRTKEHIANFWRLDYEFKHKAIDQENLAIIEEHNNIFPHVNYKLYA